VTLQEHLTLCANRIAQTTIEHLQAAWRTPSGKPSADARKTDATFSDGSFPMKATDPGSIRSAVKLRGRRKGKDRLKILDRALRLARQGKHTNLAKWIQTKKEEDRKAGLI